MRYEDHIEYIKNLPAVTPPEVFGFNQNAAISKEQGETYAMTADLLLTAGQATGGGGASAEDVPRDQRKSVAEYRQFVVYMRVFWIVRAVYRGVLDRSLCIRVL